MQQQQIMDVQSDLQNIFCSVQAHFKDQIPSEERLKEYLESEIQKTFPSACFGVGETVALLTLLFAIWKEYGPSSMPYSLTCKHPFEDGTCNLEFTRAIRMDNHTHLYCTREHETIIRRTID